MKLKLKQKDDLAIQQVKWALLNNTVLREEVNWEAQLLRRQRQKLHVGSDGKLRNDSQDPWT